jgi:hypothetical protein
VIDCAGVFDSEWPGHGGINPNQTARRNQKIALTARSHYVYDSGDWLVVCHVGPSGNYLVGFFALETGTYTIKVVNRSYLFSNAYLYAIR